MTNVSTFDLSINETADLIAAVGHKRTVLVEGHMGTGKTSLLKMLAKRFPDHIPCYFDSTTKDLGDLFVPNLKDLGEQDYVTFAPNEEFGVHLDKPVILNIDEFGKANPMVKQGLTRVLLERVIGSRPLPEGSIVFATTNLGAENVGDMLAAHQLNRITRVRMRKPDVKEWLAWAFNNDIEPSLMSWVNDNPQLFQTFEEVKNPDDNPYIFHPREQRTSFVTGRSLEAASDVLKMCKGAISDNAMTGALVGTIGGRAAMDLAAYVDLAAQLPSLDSIKQTPETAIVPTSAAAVCMVVFRTLTTIESDWMDAWMTYNRRLPTEAQAMFVNGARAAGYSRNAIVMTNKKFRDWVMENKHLFGADE